MVTDAVSLTLARISQSNMILSLDLNLHLHINIACIASICRLLIELHSSLFMARLLFLRFGIFLILADL